MSITDQDAEKLAEKLIEKFKGVFPTKEDLDQRLEKFATKEYLDQQLEKYATKEYLDQRLEKFAAKEYLDQRLEKYATKYDLWDAKTELRAEMHEGFANLKDQMMTSEDRIIHRLEALTLEVKIFSQQFNCHDAKLEDHEARLITLEAAPHR